jgi:hypothetical protein
MATTTPNFGWPVPTSTDLVKDGATAIEALGDAIDASLVDLEGGTTGQILAKASNTDMDFAWITNDVGDITAVTAGTGITGGGTSGAVTVSFDQANFGGGQFAAGKNKILNGNFSVNQRNFTSTTASEIGFDRWLYATSGSTGTYSAESFTLGAAPVAGYEGTNFARLAITTGNDFARMIQRIESVRTFAGQTATLSFWAKGTNPTTAGKLNVRLQQVFGTIGSPSTAVDLPEQDLTLTGSWVRYSYTFSVPSIAGKTITANDFLAVDIGQLSNISSDSWTLDLWGVQLEAGSTATPFQTATATIQGEISACQRYYYRQSIQATPNRFGSGWNNSTTAAYILTNFPATMRTSPTALEQTGTAGDYSLVTSGTTVTVCSSVPTIDTANQFQGISIFNVASGLTAGQGCLGRPVNTSAFLGWSAEL